MATPNYSYEKRQRELAKKRKNEEKRQRKTNPGRPDDQDAPAQEGVDSAGSPSGEAGQDGATPPA